MSKLCRKRYALPLRSGAISWLNPLFSATVIRGYHLDIGHGVLQAGSLVALYPDLHDQAIQTRSIHRDGCDGFLRFHFYPDILHHVQARTCGMGSGSILDKLSAHHSSGVCIRVHKHGFGLGRGLTASSCGLGPTHAHEKKDHCDPHVQPWFDVSAHPPRLISAYSPCLALWGL
jgi:hypothetical protein